MQHKVLINTKNETPRPKRYFLKKRVLYGKHSKIILVVKTGIRDDILLAFQEPIQQIAQTLPIIILTLVEFTACNPSFVNHYIACRPIIRIKINKKIIIR